MLLKFLAATLLLLSIQSLNAQYCGQQAAVNAVFSTPYAQGVFQFSDLQLRSHDCDKTIKIWLPHSNSHQNWSDFTCPTEQNLNGYYIYPGALGEPQGVFVLRLPLFVWGHDSHQQTCLIPALPMGSNLVASWCG